ncbi:MAG: hypothetical protein QOF43_635 [Gaiellaceae bacterium]|jgi:hypothetical protein|nr:hypothetical protein [Gaiellaceae bacterium]
MRLRTIPLLVVIIAIVAAMGAWTDRPNVKIEDGPAIVEATKPWDAIIEVTRRGRGLDGYRAILTLTGPRGTERVRAKELGHGRYQIHVRMPHGGFYAYTITVGDRVAGRGTIYSIPR